VYVRLGIRFMYRGMKGGVEGGRGQPSHRIIRCELTHKTVRRMFASMSVKQGAKFDSPDSRSAIAPFIAFHNLDMNEVLDPLDSFSAPPSMLSSALTTSLQRLSTSSSTASSRQTLDPSPTRKIKRRLCRPPIAA
jgi:hypothetical protein